jgi:hypothetical protein
MELNKWRVYLDGVLLNNIPLGLNKFSREFVRDNELFGIYSVSSFDLTFIGDGYCLLKDFQDNNSSCQKTIQVDRYCRNNWVTIFDGIIEVGSVEIDEENSHATCEIQDDSPLVLISRNSDITIDLQTDKDIFGVSVIPATFNGYVLGTPNTGIGYTSYGTTWDDAIRVLLEAITGVNVNVSSTYLNATPLPTIITLTYTGTLSNILDTTVVFTNFQGNTQTVLADFNTGVSNFDETAQRMLSSTQYLDNDAGIRNTVQFNDDYRNFYFTSYDLTAKTITLYSNLPITVDSVVVTSSGAPITVAISETQAFVDGGNNPVLFNYPSLKNYTIYNFTTSFKDLMTFLNKEYNVYFIATYNNSGEIDFVIEDYNYFANATIDYTFSNAKNLKVTFDEESNAKEINVGDSSNTTLANSSYTFSANFCGLGNTFDAKSDFIIGSVEIWNDLAASFVEGQEDKFYCIDGDGSMTAIQWTNDNYLTLVKNTGFIYNLYLTNWHKIYRHLNKFRLNVIGVASYFDPDTINYNINVTNTSTNRLFRKYEFSEQMTDTQFNNLSDVIIDKTQFKRASETTYRNGLIMSVQYDYESGKAELTILGE